MRTLHLGLRVADPDRAVAFYTAVGYEVVGRVAGHPGRAADDAQTARRRRRQCRARLRPHRSRRQRGTGLSHLVIQVESMGATVTDLRAKGIDVAEPESPDGSADFLTSWITDPDGNRIELVQWPPGHPDGLTAADWS